MNIFKDMLTERGKYSQGRVYLLWSVFAYYITLFILTWAGISPKMEVELDKFKIILDALEYAMTLFGGYVFGGKFIEAYRAINGNKKKEQTEE
jgi:hypothetical protein